MRQTQTLTLNSKLCRPILLVLLSLQLTLQASTPVGESPLKKAQNLAFQKMELLKANIKKQILKKYRLSSPSATTLQAAFEPNVWAPENCTNGIDDDGDGFIDAADPDCGCSQTVMMVARDNGQILRVNLATGGTTSVATSSPYVPSNLNAVAANADKSLVYYCSDKQVYYWVPATGQHGLVVDLTGKIGDNESLSSGGGEYYNGYIYLGTEEGNPGNFPRIWRQQLSTDGKSFIGNPVNLNAPLPTNTSWGDMIATAQGGHVVLYGMTANATSHFWKFNVTTNTYNLIRNDLPTEMQIGVDIDGNAWAGSWSSGMIQKLNTTTGYFYGNIINFGGPIWDLTGPINCPQSVEICANGIDDDNDGYTDNQDQDCLCPTITANDATTRTICEGQSVAFNATSNAPNPPYSYIEYYRFDAPQTNPYLSTDTKTWLGEFANTNGTGTVVSNDFPNATLSNKTYYVYGCVKPAPQFPASCAPLVTYTVVVQPAASLNAGSDVAICAGNSATLTALATNGPAPLTYNWSNGLGAGASKTVTPASNTTYTVTVSAGNGCTTTDQVAVSVNPMPTVNAGADVSVCVSTSTTLTAVGTSGVGPYSYDWSHGLGSGAAKTVQPSATTTYTVTITGGNGCVSTDQVKVTVTNCLENCVNGIDDDGDGLVDCADSSCGIVLESENYFCVCAGTTVSFTVSATGGSGVYTYAWDNGLGNGPSKSVTPAVTTDYIVTVTPTAGCTGTRLVHVFVQSCPEDCTNGLDDDFDGLVDCADPDCALVAPPALVNDSYTTCPGTVLTERVSYNDGNLQDPAYTISSLPTQGSVTIDGTGKFTYTPNGQICVTDNFIYQVCNQTTGCCDDATVTIVFGDTQKPTMLNVPADVVISCDDAVPAPSQVLAFDACPGIFMDFSETTNQHVQGACESFTITRTWVATDLCGNSATGDQVITVQDLTSPEIQRLYTLSSGKKLISGNAALTSELWKYVSFPITFGTTPVVFAQQTTDNEAQASTVQLRNITPQGFELRIAEQEAADGTHQPETVSWLAMEKGADFNAVFGLDAGDFANATSAVGTINYNLNFSSVPALITSLQTTNEADAATIRYVSTSSIGAQVFVDEESSKDAETTHIAEKLGYLAITADVNITDDKGDLVGETGNISLTNAWMYIPFRNAYTKPVVIMGGTGINDGDPVTIRVRNVTATGFQARLQEWTYQDGTHAVEQVGYLVVEGSMSADPGYYCDGKATNLVPNENIFVHDNCDDQVNFGYDETQEMLADGMMTTRTWAAIDDCGKTTIVSRNDTCTIAAVRLKAFLYGAYFNNQGSGLMRDDLRTKGMLPTLEPFTAISSFRHKGKGGGEVLQPSLLTVTGANAIVDWVFVEIRDSVQNNNVLATMSALLQRDGDVVSVEGASTLVFPNLPAGKYYVSVRHRNHVGMMSDATRLLTSGQPPLVDFSDMKTGAKGWNEAGKLMEGKRMMWAGDFNSDRKIIYQGPNNDVFSLFSKVLADPGNVTQLANYISTGYERTDLNLDGNSIYQGPGNERATQLYQSILTHPSNSAFLANFIVREFLP